ncbi:MAG TPA: hypothetical protein VNM14_14710 [Planctomycetota bacterium]|jgi:hypothetical protein|nr:hypothetical protein [Planctomycetota bacterium]
MIRLLGWAPFLLVSALFAAPETGEDRLQQFSGKLASDGLTGRLAEALRTDWGRRAFQERIDLVMAAPMTRIRGNEHVLWEDYYFSADSAGRLVLRPDRQAEFDRLEARRPLGTARFEQFSKRMDEVGERILEENDLDKGAKAGWKERDWRLALYYRYLCGGVADSDLDVDQIFDTRLLLWLTPRADGKLQLSDGGQAPVLQLISDVYGASDEGKKYEAPYLKMVAKADPATAKAAAADDVTLIACAKLAAEVRAGAADALSRLVELDPKQAVQDAQAVIREAARLKPRLDALAQALADDDTRSNDLKGFLKDERARVLLALRLTPSPAAVTARLDWFVANIIPGAWCDPKGDKLIFKRGFFRSGSGDSVETFRTYTYDASSYQLKVLQQLFLSTAERCAEPRIADLCRDVEMLGLLRQDVSRICESRVAALQGRGIEMFQALYFAEKDGKLVVRPDHEKALESLLRRAEDLKPKN